MPSRTKHANQFTRDELFRELDTSLRLRTAEEASPDGVSALDALQVAWQRLAPHIPAEGMDCAAYEAAKRDVLAFVAALLREAYRRSFRRSRILSKHPEDGPGPQQGPDPLQELAARQKLQHIFQKLADDADALRLLAAALPKHDPSHVCLDYKDTEALAAYLKCSTAEVANIKKRLARAARRVLAELDGPKG